MRMHPDHQIDPAICHPMGELYLIPIRTIDKFITPMHICNSEITTAQRFDFELNILVLWLRPIQGNRREMVRALAKSQYSYLFSLMFEYAMLPVIASNVSNPHILQITEHFTIGLPSMLHHMVVSHSVQVKMMNMRKILRLYDKLSSMKSCFVGTGGTYTFEITNPKIIFLPAQVFKRISPLLYRRTYAKPRIEEAVRKINITCYPKHTISGPDDSANHQ